MARRSLVMLSVFVVLLAGGCRSAPLCGEHGHEAERPPPLCAELRCGWCAPIDHAHESRCGTPYVHAFHAEPAFLGRDLLVHVEKEGDEHGLEAELEWALTRRLLVVGELPYRWTEEEDGVTDVGLAVRGLLVETDRLLVSAQTGFEFPTARGDLGADELVVAPRLLVWTDLGCWFTAQGALGFDVGAETGDTELSWGAVLAKSFPCRPLFACGSVCAAHDAHGGHGEDEEGHEHHHAHFLTLFLEGRGIYPLSGPDEGSSEHEVLFGISFPLSDGFDLRAGWTLRWDDANDAASGWAAGFVLHL